MNLRSLVKVAALIAIFCLLSIPAKAQISFSNSLSLYGWMDQYSMNAENNFVGDEACVPTSSVNALVYLQNLNPSLFGTAFTGGTNYSDCHALDNQLISLYGTTATNGTYYAQFVYALQEFVQQTNGFSQVSFASMFPSDNWYIPYTDPSFNVNGHPTPDFLSSELSSESALLVSIEYDGGGGHELLANAITWDTNTSTGTLSFVDPLDPSLNYSGTNVLGTALETTGTLSLDSNGVIKMDYTQYEGGLPYSATNFSTVSVKLYGALGLTVVPEPSTVVLMILSGVIMAVCMRRRNS